MPACMSAGFYPAWHNERLYLLFVFNEQSLPWLSLWISTSGHLMVCWKVLCWLQHVQKSMQSVFSFSWTASSADRKCMHITFLFTFQDELWFACQGFLTVYHCQLEISLGHDGGLESWTNLPLSNTCTPISLMKKKRELGHSISFFFFYTSLIGMANSSTYTFMKDANSMINKSKNLNNNNQFSIFELRFY